MIPEEFKGKSISEKDYNYYNYRPVNDTGTAIKAEYFRESFLPNRVHDNGDCEWINRRGSDYVRELGPSRIKKGCSHVYNLGDGSGNVGEAVWKEQLLAKYPNIKFLSDRVTLLDENGTGYEVFTLGGYATKLNHKLHNLEGPAQVTASESQYWINGKQYTEDQYLKKIDKIKSSIISLKTKDLLTRAATTRAQAKIDGFLGNKYTLSSSIVQYFAAYGIKEPLPEVSRNLRVNAMAKLGTNFIDELSEFFIKAPTIQKFLAENELEPVDHSSNVRVSPDANQERVTIPSSQEIAKPRLA